MVLGPGRDQGSGDSHVTRSEAQAVRGQTVRVQPMTVCLSGALYHRDTADGHHGNRVLGGNCNHVPGRQL